MLLLEIEKRLSKEIIALCPIRQIHAEKNPDGSGNEPASLYKTSVRNRSFTTVFQHPVQGFAELFEPTGLVTMELVLSPQIWNTIRIAAATLAVNFGFT
jgi:hypothetical protein